MANKRIKVAGYAQRIFFNDNIEYRDFSPDLVGLQLTSDGGTTLFTNGNFTISTNLDPKPDTLFIQGKKSKFFTLEDIVESDTPQLEIQKNIKTKLNIDLTNPLSYIWYGSAKEMVKASLIEIQEKWPAAIYVDNKVGSVTGNNITNYVYDIESDESTFTVNSNYFINPYGIKYTIDAQYVGNNDSANPLRNFTLNYGSYLIEHNGISKKIKSITPSTQKTNSTIELVVEGNPFPELTGIYIPQLSFLFNNVDGSIPYFIKPNESEIEKFFSGLNELQSNLLNRNIYPKYKSEVISTNYTDDGVLLTSKSVLTFPVLDDGYNLNFFDSFYIAYIDQLNDLGKGLDDTKTDIIVRKYTTEAISSFDTVPRADGNDLVLNGEKATKLLRIYGVEFDYVKKYINAIKFAHVVTYDKKNNVPDTLIKDLALMLGFEPINFIDSSSLSKLFLPSNGSGLFSGTSTNLTESEIDVELYRRIILNIAWLWKSKGSRKAVEFLFRFIGAPESLANFNEYVVIVDKPLDMVEIKKLLYLYTGDVNLDNIPYDENGFPLPPINGDIVISNYIDPETGEIVENDFTEMYFQKGGGWYRETYGSNSPIVLNGNNPHVGKYDGGNEYLQYFSRCFIPNFDNEPTVTLTAKTLVQNYFINYNYGIFNGINDNSEIFTNQLTFNALTNSYQPINECLNVNYSIIETPLQNDGKTTLQQAFSGAQAEYNRYLQLIKENSYLQYSPEWETIKNNYELSLKNCLNEISTENCDINKTLEICLSENPKDLVVYSCNNLNLENASPFIYYTNSDGVKVSFDEFPSCCASQDAKYVSYVNEYGRQTEYCSSLAPCVGNPISTLPNGVIEFEMVNNTTPKDIIQIETRCFQYINTTISFEDFSARVDATSYVSDFCLGFVDREFTYQYGYGRTNCGTYFKEVTCNSTSIVSSPECCAWYGYGFEIIEQGDYKFIVCKEKNQLTTPGPRRTGIGTKYYNEYTLPIIDFSVNSSYYNLQNPIGDVYNYYSTEIFWDNFNKARIVKEVVPGSKSLSLQPSSVLQDPSLMTPSNWKVDSIDEYGRVSFTPKTFTDNFILDWYSSDLLSDLYKTVATYYGYKFSKFTFDYNNNVLVPFVGDNLYSDRPNSVITAAVDSNRVACGDVNSVAVVFASEKWKGFNLPKLDDCSCTIDFSFDYMLKYDVNNLTRCASGISCYPAFIYDNTIDNINCLNFVAFTNNANTSVNLQRNFNDSTFVTEEYVLWQNSTILEPNVECCKAVTGNVVAFREWAESNQTWVKKIEDTYIAIYQRNTSVLNSLDFDYTPIYNQAIKYFDLKSIFYDSLPYAVISEGVGGFDGSGEEYNTNIADCGGTTYNQVVPYSYESVSPSESNYVPPMAEMVVVDKERTLNSLETQKVEQIAILRADEVTLTSNINDLKNTIGEKESTNIVIRKALTSVNSDLDCSIYEVSIKEIDNFNYKEYCNTIIYNGGINDGSKNVDYNNCVSTKTIENSEQKLVYSELLNSCILKNQLNSQLVNSKFENNQVLTTTLENQIQQLNVKINELTTNANSVIAVNESYQNSKLLENDTQNTINVVSEILNVSPQSITDSSGNLVISDSQKLKLNVELTKNESQISGLNRDVQNYFDSLNENIQNQKYIEYGTNFIQNDLKTNINNINLVDPPITQPTTQRIGISPTTDNKISNMDYNQYTGEFNNLTWVKPDYNPITEEFIPVRTDYNQFITEDLIPTKPINNGFDASIGGEYNKTEEVAQVVNVGTGNFSDCCLAYLKLKENNTIQVLNDILLDVQESINFIKTNVYNAYNRWNDTLENSYENYIESSTNYLKYIDDLKINFKLFVDNNNIDVNNSIDTSLTYLPYTQSINPIWEFNPSEGYSGILLEGDEQSLALVEESIFDTLSSKNINYNSNLFEPDWKTFNFTIPECVCDDLRRLYPNKDFYFSIEIENYECDVCLLVDNIMVNVSDCKTDRIVSINNCLIPQLSCVIDNKKSWVYYEDGVVKETVYPNGECNGESITNFEVVKINAPQERLWTDLEYRYTNYDNYHSDLLLNVKNTTFSIDPAKSIECDVFNFWRNIDCDNCPTSNNCDSDNYIFQTAEDYLFMEGDDYIFQDQIITYSNFNDTLDVTGTSFNYNLNLGNATFNSLSFSCETYTNTLQNQVIELKNKYYTLTSNYSDSLNSTYYDLLEKGETLSNFYINKNNCGGDTLVLNNNNQIGSLFNLIVEDSDGTLGLFDVYTYSGTPTYSGGYIQEILSGVTAQTFNQTNNLTKECCESINTLLNVNGINGLGLGKNYQWDEENNSCNWYKNDDCSDCKGDCEYCSKSKSCVSGVTSGDTYSVCINPLDFLDIDTSNINIKDIFDDLVLSNLIDAKSRQTISDYPLLRLFYELYLKANNCGKNLSNKFTYDSMFEFMDKIGDYWLDLIEQVVPATTIWEGCDNSGKIYRNTIFDQNKFKYKKSSLNFVDATVVCPLSAQTEYSIGSKTIHSLVEQKPIYPTNPEIENLKKRIKFENIRINNNIRALKNYEKVLCSLKLKDVDTPNLNNQIRLLNNQIQLLNNSIKALNSKVLGLTSQLGTLETKYKEQQNNFDKNFMSCSGLSETLKTAEDNLTNYVPGTTSYERQRNFIASIKDKYYRCVRKSNVLVTDYNTVFITQIYDTNEYEGNVTIIGDDDWVDGGPFNNKELIHNCESSWERARNYWDYFYNRS